MRFVAVGFGTAFGFLLAWAQLTDPGVIQRMLLLREIDVYLLMATAMAVAYVGVRLLRALPSSERSRSVAKTAGGRAQREPRAAKPGRSHHHHRPRAGVRWRPRLARTRRVREAHRRVETGVDSPSALPSQRGIRSPAEAPPRPARAARSRSGPNPVGGRASRVRGECAQRTRRVANERAERSERASVATPTGFEPVLPA